MSDTNNNGGSAFPTPHLHAMNGEVVNFGATGGMSIRDYFAAKAMQGMIAKSVHDETFGDFHEGTAQVYSQKAYIMADAMLAAKTGGAQ